MGTLSLQASAVLQPVPAFPQLYGGDSDVINGSGDVTNSRGDETEDDDGTDNDETEDGGSNQINGMTIP